MKRLVSLLLGIVLLIGVCSFSAEGAQSYSTQPVTKDGKKWRMGYYEGGQYADYQMILRVIVEGLVKLGWVKVDMPPNTQFASHKEFWDWLSKNAKSDYIEFVADGYYAPGDFDKELRPKVREELLKRLAEKKDIDLMLALGTWAGQDLATPENTVPTIVASCSDPIKSGIVKSADDSGQDNLHAKVEPERYERQIRLFHDIVGFKRLGVVYEDSPEGRTFAAMDAVERVAKERGFQVVACNAPFSNISIQEAEKGVIKCYEQIAPKVDAVYITVHRGVSNKTLPSLLAPLYKHKVPTFSMLGSNEVRHGALMSIAQAGFKFVGQFHAETIARIFNGAKPRALDQKWQDPPKIAINLKVAEIIGYDPPVDIMMASDEIYERIEKPEAQ